MGFLDPWSAGERLISPREKRPAPMPAPELVAYPTLLAVTYGLYRVGRRRPVSYKDGFEWVRACSLVILLGVIASVQVHLILVGSVTSTVGRVGVALGLAAAFSLVGLTFYEMFDAGGARVALL